MNFVFTIAQWSKMTSISYREEEEGEVEREGKKEEAMVKAP